MVEYFFSANKSIRREDDVVNITINNNGDYFDVDAGNEFASLQDLVSYYTIPGNTLTESNGNVVEAKFPIFSNNELMTEKWYHGNINGKQADEILKQNGKLNCFLVRERITIPGEFVLSILTGHDVITNVLIIYQDNMYAMKSNQYTNHFQTLKELIEHYKHSPFTLQSGQDTTIGEPAVTDYVLFQEPIERQKKDLDIEQLKMQFVDLQIEGSHVRFTKSEGSRPLNEKKNRYGNILPYDHSRVILRDGDPNVDGSDYINANHVQIEDCSLAFIATQGCVSATVSDFWRMVWHENPHIIVMLTKNVENGKSKCIVYWPARKTEPLELNFYNASLTVELIHMNCDRNNSFAIREFKLSYYRKTNSTPNEPTNVISRTVYHYHFIKWPDKSVPERPEPLLDLFIHIRSKQLFLENPGPIVVHCSAGIGRTGTFIAMGLIIHEIFTKGEENMMNLKNVVSAIRKCRAGMVQQESQYVFIDNVLKYFFEKRNAQETAYANI